MEYRKEKVSDDLAKVLDHWVGDTNTKVSSSVEQELKQLLSPELAASYRRCTWYRGCYYCNDGSGWYIVYCIA